MNQEIEDMKYILMMNTMRSGQGVPDWPQKDLQAHIAFMKSLPGDGRYVSGKQGIPGGLLDRRCQHTGASLCSRRTNFSGAGTSGSPLNMPIEVRPVPSGPPPEML
jgi:hypothetical protein